MDSSTADSALSTRSRSRRVGIAVVFALLLSSVIAGAMSLADPVLAVVALVILAGLTVAVARFRSRSADAEAGADVWNAIPSTQYEGRHVESGGLARSEQESALREVQRRAEELEER